MNHKAKTTLLAAVLAAAIGLPAAVQAQAAADAGTALSKKDQEIVVGMARANMAEIAAAKIALTNAEGAEVKSFAQKMIDDHTQALNDVTALAQKKGLTLPAELDAKHKSMGEKLSKLKGGTFDKLYMRQAGVADHKQVRARLKKDLAQAQDPEVKALAAKMLPTVEQHLETAKSHKH